MTDLEAQAGLHEEKVALAKVFFFQSNISIFESLQV